VSEVQRERRRGKRVGIGTFAAVLLFLPLFLVTLMILPPLLTIDGVRVGAFNLVAHPSIGPTSGSLYQAVRITDSAGGDLIFRFGGGVGEVQRRTGGRNQLWVIGKRR
jgi:hypothetical protein